MKKSMIAFHTAVVLGLASLTVGTNANAESIKSLEEKKKQIQSKKSNVQSDINEADEKIDALEGQQSTVKAELVKVEESIKKTTDEINTRNNEIAEVQKAVDKLNSDIKVIEERIEKRNEILRERARAYQENGGGMNYLEVVFGASSFGEFVERLSAVSTIMDADKEIMIQQEKDKAELEKKKAEVEKKLSSLNSMKQELEAMKEKLDGVKIEKNRLMLQLKAEQQKVETLKMDLEEQNQLLASQASALQKAIKLEQQRQAQASAASNGSSAGLPPVSSGMFTRPAAGYLSSGYGHRSGGFHHGIDIAKSGHVPVVAAASGVVTRSNFSSSYGNVIYLTHYINGQQYTTVYAHLSSRNVVEGATVSKGQQIGVMGNTGQSYGQHLHFELYVGPWTASHSNAVNPLKYLSGM